jgi:hypothetical protein
MPPERIVLCGGANGRGITGDYTPLILDIYPPNRNINFGLEAIRRALWTDIPKILRDLVDVALYVYAADQAVQRAGGGKVDGIEIGAGWRRRFRFRIPVRELDLWNSHDVRDCLVSLLSFLSEDEYFFEFFPLRKDAKLDGFIDFDESAFEGDIEEVMMFSGGLDSLAGAITESVVDRRRILLVNHRPNEKMAPHYDRLLKGLNDKAHGCPPLQFGVKANKQKRFGREHTQRTRSFLFAAFGTLFARMAGLARLRFYENGVVSLNLPPSAQVVGARASRTTHPRVLAGFQTLFTTLLGRKFTVENPFMWDTKTDVVKRIAHVDCGNLIGLSLSCGHTWDLKSKTHTHCGVCSQCIDRRFAVLAAGQEANDPASAYAVDLLVGNRDKEEDVTMLASYIALAERLDRMGEADFRASFGELARALHDLGLPLSTAATRVFEMYRTHARHVLRVIEQAVRTNAGSLSRRKLPATCLLRIACDDRSNEETTAPSANRPEGNYFIQRGQCWAVRYGDDEEKSYTPDIGFEYLQILLGHPGTTYSAAQLALQVRTKRLPTGSTARPASEKTGRATALGSDPILDDEASTAYGVRLQEIKTAIEQAEASGLEGSVELIDDLEKERCWLQTELQRARNKRGQQKKLGDERNKVRNRVCNAIKRAVKRIAEYDPPLAAHLDKLTLRTGHSLCYSPKQTVTWQTES